MRNTDICMIFTYMKYCLNRDREKQTERRIKGTETERGRNTKNKGRTQHITESPLWFNGPQNKTGAPGAGKTHWSELSLCFI
jgi:hypothetical protein